MEIKDWKTSELMEFLNSYRTATEEDRLKYEGIMIRVRSELNKRHPLIGRLYN